MVRAGSHKNLSKRGTCTRKYNEKREGSLCKYYFGDGFLECVCIKSNIFTKESKGLIVDPIFIFMTFNHTISFFSLLKNFKK